ncbi:MAG: hypothetical protein LBB41_06005 [Prevotellaceae bacterium]|jgi:chromosome segregation ATPase|nr:hypothetical protein [Prevotellaceae bacterium]
MTDFLTIILLQILPALLGSGSLIALIFERKKRKAETLQSIQAIYDEFVRDYSEKITELKNQVAEFQRETEKMRAELQQEKNRFSNLQKKYIALNDKYNRLKREFSNYKKLNNGRTNATKS